MRKAISSIKLIETFKKSFVEKKREKRTIHTIKVKNTFYVYLVSSQIYRGPNLRQEIFVLYMFLICCP